MKTFLFFFLTLFYSEVQAHTLCTDKETGVAVMHATPMGTGKTAEERKTSQSKAVLKLLETVPAASGLIVLPEAILTPWVDDQKSEFQNAKHARPYAYELPKLNEEPLASPFSELVEAAKGKRAFIQVGLFEREKDSDRVYNTALVIGPDGKVVAKHRKVNLTPDEKKYITPGEHRIATFNAEKVGLGEVGIAICADIYDGRHPHLMEKYRQSNINLLAVSAEWLAEKDPDEGFTNGWGPLNFFSETARYMNRGEGLTNAARFPERQQAQPHFQPRKDRQISVAVSNTSEPAKGAGIFLADGTTAKNKLPTLTPWILSCLPKKSAPAAASDPKTHR